MSHRPERKEKDCLNCGTIVHGKYCHICGQENVEPKESFWGMVLHFFYDITHFDGKFFSTMKVLFRKPGFLTKEYVKGRRSSYLNPVRMYVFTSAFFFLIFFNFFPISEGGINKNDSVSKLGSKILADSSELYKNAHTHEDSMIVSSALALFSDTAKGGNDSATQREGLKFSISEGAEKYKSVSEYNSEQDSLPSSKKDGWLKRILTRKMIDLNIRYEGRESELGARVSEKFLHMLPYLLFVSLPLYALFLKLLYVRKRKQYYYADHGLFLIHLYIFTFLLLLGFFLFLTLKDNTGWILFNFLQAALIIYGIIYALLAMKRFYNQGWPKTISKFILFNILCTICISVLFILFLGLTVYMT